MLVRVVATCLVAIGATLAGWWISVAASEWRDPVVALVVPALAGAIYLRACGLSVLAVALLVWGLGFGGPAGTALAWVALAGFLAYRKRLRPWRIGAAALACCASFIVASTTADTRAMRGDASLACLGDSSTDGLWVREPYCALLGGVNAAVPGASIRDLFGQLARVEAERPAVVVVMPGGNSPRDAGADEYRATLAAIDARVRAWGGRLVVVEYTRGVAFGGGAYRVAIDAAPSDALVVRPGLSWWDVSADHIHPTAAGHRRIARAVAEAIQAAERREEG